ncbi:C1 family peptidase [candidate division CSSED10-310 bacterium]|uniref:C1 family peptidase n=1 Tax=candidate division CSSED10-310 bacterium TaxID=2855610 RepID=A0ABV6Z079_UNCC1
MWKYWRSNNGVTPIKNQGGCGSCWSFATIGALESAILIGDGAPVNLSEQEVVNGNSFGYGCNGGWLDAFDHSFHIF